MEQPAPATRPSLMSLVSYLEEAARRLATEDDALQYPGELLEACAQMACLLMGVYTDVPVTFAALSSAAMRLVRSERTPETISRSLAIVIRQLIRSAENRGERVGEPVAPITLNDLRSYLLPLPRRVPGSALAALKVPPPPRPIQVHEQVRHSLTENYELSASDRRLLLPHIANLLRTHSLAT